jgi:hypothetical protein
MISKALFGLVVGALFVNLNQCFGQQASDGPKKGDIYKVECNLKNSLRDFDIDQDVCGTNKFSVQENSLLMVVKVLNPQTIIFKAYKAFKSQSDSINEIRLDETYCMSSDKLGYLKLQNQTETGFLTIPFKLRVKPVKVYFGGNLGYFIGHRYDKRQISKTLLGFAGLSTVELNDINSDVPQTKLGVTMGGGYVWKLRNDFQVGVITGIDIFDGVEDWAYKFQPWVAFGIGFKFTSRSETSQSKLMQTLQTR